MSMTSGHRALSRRGRGLASNTALLAGLLVGAALASLACTGIVDGDGNPRGKCMGSCPDAPNSTGNGPSGETGDGTTDPPGIEGIGWTSRFPRLSHVQWENTVRDLLRLDALPNLASTFTLDPPARFDTYGVRTVAANLWTDYQRSAETLAKTVAQDAAKRALIVPEGADATKFVTEFGKRAYRRALAKDEIDRYVALFGQGQELLGGSDAFASGVEVVLRAFLQSVHFLYRVEGSTTAKDNKIWLNGYEVASRLSYAFWNSMPSDELLAAAAGTELTTPQGVESWTRKLIGDARAGEVLVSFHSQLFHVEQLGTTEKSKSMFPNFTTALAPVLQEEARLFFDEVMVKSNANAGDLFTRPVTFVNQQTAPFYGLSVTGTNLQKVELDSNKRAGILTQIGFLSRFGTQTQSDPIRRGATIYTEILCEELIQPNNVPALPAQQAGETNRERVANLTAVAPCDSCHVNYINSLGFAFENYDAIGQWRDTESGKPIDASATFELDGKEVSYNNAIELSKLLAKSPMVHECYSKSLLEYVLGRPVAEEETTVKENLGSVSTAGATMQDLITKVTALETFRARPQEIK